MITIASGHVTSTAPPSAFFERWADMATWPEWNLDVDWVHLDVPFAQGATGTLKPKGGPKVRFVVESLVRDKEFVDVSRLVGARLTFAHRVTEAPGGGCIVDVQITMSGPVAFLWSRILGSGMRASVQPDLERLARVAEAAHTRSA